MSKTRFFIGSPSYEPILRRIVITNTFTFPLVIYRVVAAPDIQDSVSVSMFAYTFASIALRKENIHIYLKLDFNRRAFRAQNLLHNVSVCKFRYYISTIIQINLTWMSHCM